MNTDFDELLRDGLERFTADLHAPANLVDRARRSRNRRRTLGVTAGGLAAAAVAAIAFAVAPSNAPVISVSPSGAVSEQHDIEYVHLAAPRQDSQQIWAYRSQIRQLLTGASSGHPFEDAKYSLTKSRTGQELTATTVVDYHSKTYGKGRHSFPFATSRISCHLLSEIAYPVTPAALPAWIAAIHRLIRCGTIKVSGTEQIHGIKTIRLEVVKMSQLGSGLHETIWVKRTDYAPIRIITGQGTTSRRADMSWLPPTKANLALLRVPIPSGFRRVPLSQIFSSSSSSGSCHVSSSQPHKQICTSSS